MSTCLLSHALLIFKTVSKPSLRDAFACPNGVSDTGHLLPGQVPREAPDLEDRLDHLRPRVQLGGTPKL